MQNWYRARELAHGSAVALGVEQLALADALGRTLAAPLVAQVHSPAAHRSAMDGYAVSGQAPWRVVGQSLAGDEPSARLDLGQAIEIATGAVPPSEASAVLPYEAAHVTEGLVYGRIAEGKNIRRRGEEFAAGQDLVSQGTKLGPVHLGLAAAMGLDVVTANRIAAVSAVVTGAEVTTRGIPKLHQVRDAIGPMLPGMITSTGARFAGVAHCADDPGALEEWLEIGDDIVLVTGASSAGPTDFLAPTLQRLGGRNLVSSVACRPGHPQSLWRLGKTFVVGLPGNPLAALSAFVTLAVPLIAAMHSEPLDSPMPVRFNEAAPTQHRRPPAHLRAGRTILTPAHLQRGLLTFTSHSGSAMLRGAAQANGFAITGPEPDTGPLFLAFPWSTTSASQDHL